jgi:hypothetical protein
MAELGAEGLKAKVTRIEPRESMPAHRNGATVFGEDRAERFALRLTLRQLDAIANDTRLPGEIASQYGVSAAVLMRIQRKAREFQRQSLAAAARALAEIKKPDAFE